MTDYKWHLFISHASEDKETFVRPLADELGHRGLRVWYDDQTLTLGDSLRKKIDEGLSQSRYGLVVLSPRFFEKAWPQRELDALVALENNQRKVILPIWHQVDFEDVCRFSPLLADRLAVSTARGLGDVVTKILEALSSAPKTESANQGNKTDTSPDLAKEGRQKALLAQLGIKCFSLIHPPNSRPDIVGQIRAGIQDVSRELDLLHRSEDFPEDASATIDLLGRRIRAKLKPSDYAAFMIGCIGMAMIEHHDNPQYQKDFISWVEQAHGRPLSPHFQDAIWRRAATRDVDSIHRLITTLAEAETIL